MRDRRRLPPARLPYTPLFRSVPRTVSLQREYRRKVRTMARGLETLWFKRHLLNPLRHGRFAWMLWSHKLIRWLVFLVAPVALLRSEEHTSELQSRENLVCRLL